MNRFCYPSLPPIFRPFRPFSVTPAPFPVTPAPFPVTPAKAGVQGPATRRAERPVWIPAFAGMTNEGSVTPVPFPVTPACAGMTKGNAGMTWSAVTQ